MTGRAGQYLQDRTQLGSIIKPDVLAQEARDVCLSLCSQLRPLTTFSCFTVVDLLLANNTWTWTFCIL